MDGVTMVQARIGQIQARFQGPIYRTGSSSDWTTAARAAGLTGTASTGSYGASGAGVVSPSGCCRKASICGARPRARSTSGSLPGW